MADDTNNYAEQEFARIFMPVEDFERLAKEIVRAVCDEFRSMFLHCSADQVEAFARRKARCLLEGEDHNLRDAAQIERFAAQIAADIAKESIEVRDRAVEEARKKVRHESEHGKGEDLRDDTVINLEKRRMAKRLVGGWKPRPDACIKACESYPEENGDCPICGVNFVDPSGGEYAIFQEGDWNQLCDECAKRTEPELWGALCLLRELGEEVRKRCRRNPEWHRCYVELDEAGLPIPWEGGSWSDDIRTRPTSE